MTDNLFHSSLYDRSVMPATYWAAVTPQPARFAPLSTDATVDVAIIGAGFSGLSAALHLTRDEQRSALVLESGDIGWGASGRNAGFNTLPASKLSTAALFARWGDQQTRAFFASQCEGQQLLYELAKQENFDLQTTGDGIYQVAHHRRAFQELTQERTLLHRAGIACRVLSRDEFIEAGHGGPEQHGALFLAGGGINPLALTYGLADAARRHGAAIHPHSAMSAWRKVNGWHILNTAQGKTVRARQVIIATNAYRDGTEPTELQRRVLPAISNILVTKPLSDAQWQRIGLNSLSPISDTRHLVSYYRRLPDRRLLMGARGDTHGDPLNEEKMRIGLLKLIAHKFPAAGPLEVDYFWRGLVSLTRKMLPTFGPLPGDHSVWFNFGCFGSGVNTMPWIGRAMARGIAGNAPTALEACALYRRLPERLPKARWLQRKGLQMAYAYYAVKDRL